MTTVACGKWIVDLLEMSCWNSITNVTISFENRENTLSGKIKHMPVALMKKWMKDPYGIQFLKNMLSEAKETYLKAYMDSYSLYYD